MTDCHVYCRIASCAPAFEEDVHWSQLLAEGSIGIFHTEGLLALAGLACHVQDVEEDGLYPKCEPERAQGASLLGSCLTHEDVLSTNKGAGLQ